MLLYYVSFEKYIITCLIWDKTLFVKNKIIFMKNNENLFKFYQSK